MSYTGRVESVYLAVAGGVVTADASIGATTISVQFPVDFDETGGSFTRSPVTDGTTDATVYAYTAVDVDGETITLASALTVGFSAGDSLAIWPQASEARALVRLADSQDEPAADCRVRHALRPLLAVGSRDIGTGESVLVDQAADGLVVVDMVGADPVITGARFLATGDSQEVMIYGGEAAAGNLIASVSTDEGVDALGNYYLAGVVSYEFDTANSLYVAAQVNAGTVAFYTATTMAGPSNPWTLGPKIDGWSVQTGTLSVFGPVAFADPFQVLDPVAGTIEGWHDLGSLGVSGISFTQARYRLTPDGEVEFDLNGSASGTVTASAANFANTLPSAYRPANTRQYPVAFGASDVGRLEVQTGGTVRLNFPNLASGNIIGCGFHMPRD